MLTLYPASLVSPQYSTICLFGYISFGILQGLWIFLGPSITLQGWKICWGGLLPQPDRLQPKRSRCPEGLHQSFQWFSSEFWWNSWLMFLFFFDKALFSVYSEFQSQSTLNTATPSSCGSWKKHNFDTTGWSTKSVGTKYCNGVLNTFVFAVVFFSSYSLPVNCSSSKLFHVRLFSPRQTLSWFRQMALQLLHVWMKWRGNDFELGTRWIFHKFPIDAWELYFFSCETPLMGCFFCFWLSEAQAAAGHKMKDLGQSLLEKTFEVPGWSRCWDHEIGGWWMLMALVFWPGSGFRG